MTQPSERLAKKSYQPPKLQVYGNLAEMTKAKGVLGKRDGGNMQRRRHTG
jgi:hypothetical protein